MNCPACNHENREGAKFCEECATPLKRVCAGCGSELRPTAKFCDECGMPVAAGAQPGGGTRTSNRSQQSSSAGDAGARKVVTILFADLAGSTALQERLDAESARVFMERYYEAMRRAVAAHGGAVAKLLGDGVLAVFGTPRVAEDDAPRAVRAAFEMRQAFRALAEQHGALVGAIGLRVAVNTGEVVASDDAEIVGDPVNVAARLQEQAGDGDVVIGEATQRLVSTTYTLEPLGSISLKGRAGDVKAYRVVSLERPAGAAATPFVGRDEELARIARVYEEATSKPAARLAVLVGSPGLGKSRLIDEFVRRQSEQAAVVFAHCDAAGSATFAPLAEALREHLEIDDGADVDAVRAAISDAIPQQYADRSRIVDGIAALLGGSPASPEETFFVVRRLLSALATSRPVVLVIDDLQWAEPLLFDLVEHLVQWGADVPLLVLVGARPELRDARSSLATVGGLVSDLVTLAGLSASASMQLAASVVGAADLPAAVAAKVLTASEGNPLFVGELVRMLVQEGALERQGDRWTVGAGLADLEMPPTIHALLAARIERLQAEDRIVLERAAIVGRQFSRSAVAELLPGNGADLDARLESLRRSELIERDTGWFLGEPALRFHHSLIRDAAYRRVLKGTRAELHARLADWIEARVGESIEHDETTGWHLEQAYQHLGELGPVDAKARAFGERAANKLSAAGRRALGRDDVSLAANLLGRALDCLDPADPKRPDLVLDCCEALLSAGDVTPAAAAIDELDRFAADSDRLRAWHTCFAGQLAVMTAPEALHATADAVAVAAEQLGSLEDTAGEAKAHFVHAQTLARLGKIGACEAALDRALAAARSAGDRRRANAVLAGAPLAALWGPSAVTRASGRCLDVVRVLRITQGAPAVEAVALSCQGVLEALRGRTDAARRMIASSRSMVEELGITHRLFETDVFSARIDLLEGDPAAAERSLRTAYDGLRDLGLGSDAARAGALLAQALLAQDRADEAEALSHESETLAGDDLQAAIAWRVVRAEALARRGETASAIEFAEAAVAIASATDALLDHAEARLALATALRAAGRTDDANAEERRANELWEAKGATSLAKPADHDSEAAAATVARLRNTQAPARRRIVPNAAVATITATDAAIAAGDIERTRALFAEDYEELEHRTGATISRDGVCDSVQRLLRSQDASLTNEPLATLGSNLCLTRRRVHAAGSPGARFDVGEYMSEAFTVLEVDERGLQVRGETFAADRLGDAVAQLYARYAEQLPAGPERERATVVARAARFMLTDSTEDDYEDVMVADIASVDYRTVGYGELVGAEFGSRWREAGHELTQNVSFHIDDVLALNGAGILRRSTGSGELRETGGAFEVSTLVISIFGPDGRQTRFEIFEADQEARALARFDELTGAARAAASAALPTDSPGRRVRPNAASATGDRMVAAIAVGDEAPMLRLASESYQEIDHSTGAVYGRDGAQDSLTRFLRSSNAVLAYDRLATIGERWDLARRRVRASGTAGARFDVGPYETEAVCVSEVDERGLLSRHEVFASDHLGEALERLYEMYAESLSDLSARERGMTIARSVVGSSKGLSDPDNLANPFAPDVEVIDNRIVGFGNLRGAEQVLGAIAAFLELAENTSWRIDDILALDADTGLVRATNRGMDRAGGGEFEREILALSRFNDAGLIGRWEIFEADAAAAALTRFDELTGTALARPMRRVRPNAASATAQRIETAMRARDGGSIEVMLHEDHVTIDHPSGAEFGRTGQLESMRRIFRQADFELRLEILATLGESLCLYRRLISASGTTGGHFDVGDYEMEHFTVNEVDAEGRIVRAEVFAADHLSDALACLYARYAGQFPEGPEHDRAALTAAGVRIMSQPEDFGTTPDCFAPDIELVDHRLLGTWVASGLAATLEQVQGLLAVADNIVMHDTDVLAAAPNALVGRRTHSGNERLGGGYYENKFVFLFCFGPDGRMIRQEWFDEGSEAQALARFDQLTNAAPAHGTRALESRFANTVTRMNERYKRAWNAGNFDALRALHTPELNYEDRRRLMQGTTSGETTLDSIRFMLGQPGSRMTVTPVATRGERLALSRAVYEAAVDEHGGELAIDYLSVDEVDADERYRSSTMFDLDDLGAAYAELDRRFEAGEATQYPVTSSWAAAYRRHFAARDWDAFGKILDGSGAAHDHRRLIGWGTASGSNRPRVLEILVELAPDVRLHVEHERLSDRGLLWQALWQGTRDGGPFESPFLMVAELGDHGKARRIDVFDVDMLDRARARFDEINAVSPTSTEQRAESRFANTVTRLNEQFERAWNAGNVDALRALHTPAMQYDDRRRLMQGTTSGETSVESMRFLLEQPGSRMAITPLATRGGRLALSRAVYEAAVDEQGGELAIDYLHIDEVNADGLFCSSTMLDPDDLDAAYAELDARYAAGESAADAHGAKAAFDVIDAFNARDWDTLGELVRAVGFGANDHRILGWGTALLDPDEWIRSQKALVELSPDARYRFDHIRSSDRAQLAVVVQAGTREGGAFESPFITVGAWDENGTFVSNDLYDVERVDDAFARFEELSTPSPPTAPSPPAARTNAAVAMFDRWNAAFKIGAASDDWDSMRALCSADMGFEDRQRHALVRGDCELMIRSARERALVDAHLESMELIGTAGERIAVWRVVWIGGPPEGRFEIAYHTLIEVDGAGLVRNVVLIDIDDPRSAQREMIARWAAIDPSLAKLLNLTMAWSDAFNDRDTAALRATMADDVVVNDRRWTGMGRMDGVDGYLAALDALRDLAPDTRMELGWHWPACRANAAIATARRTGTIKDGGEYETELLSVFSLRDDRVATLDFFEIDALDEALAYFEELNDDPLAIPPNAAARAARESVATAAAGDWAALAAHVTEDFVYEDRGKRALVTGNVDTWIDSNKFIREQPGASVRIEIIATLGDRLVLELLTWTIRAQDGESDVASEIDKLRLMEVDPAGRLRASVLFDADDRAAAYDEACKRFIAGEGAECVGQAEIFEYLRAFLRRDWDAARKMFANDFVFDDHRTLGLGTLSADGWLESIDALVTLAPDVRGEHVRDLAHNKHGRVTLLRLSGTVPDGGPFENVMVSVMLVANGKLQRWEPFNIEDADRALARFEELCAAAGRHSTPA